MATLIGAVEGGNEKKAGKCAKNFGLLDNIFPSSDLTNSSCLALFSSMCHEHINMWYCLNVGLLPQLSVMQVHSVWQSTWWSFHHSRRLFKSILLSLRRHRKQTRAA